MIRIILVDDVRLKRESLAHILSERDEMCVVGAVGHPALALAMVQDLEPEVVLVDVQVPGSEELINSIASSFEQTTVVALGACSEATVSVLPDASLTDVIAAIHGAAHSAVIRLPTSPVDFAHSVENSCLTAREGEIVALIDKGLSNKEIARSLNMAVSTVKNHVHHILKKLAVTRRGQAAAALRAHSAAWNRESNRLH